MTSWRWKDRCSFGIGVFLRCIAAQLSVHHVLESARVGNGHATDSAYNGIPFTAAPAPAVIAVTLTTGIDDLFRIRKHLLTRVGA
jgi:hypothetical protein